MRLTEEQATATISAMRADQTAKNALLAQWRNGDDSARFVVYGLHRRQSAPTIADTEVAAALIGEQRVNEITRGWGLHGATTDQRRQILAAAEALR